MKVISTAAPVDAAWSALRDVGQLHTRLVPGFVTDTKLETGARIVTFANGMVVREIIVTLDEDQRRVVWSAVGGSLTHHNGSAQVSSNASGATTIVWNADFPPNDAATTMDTMMDQGTLDQLPR